MKKLILFLIILFLLTAPLSIAKNEEPTLEDAYSWLIKNINGETSVFDASLTALAINQVDQDTAETLLQWIYSQKNKEGCYPKKSCKIKDTAMALMALSQSDFDTAKGEEWLLNQIQTNKEGDLNLQIKTDSTGTCTIDYTKKGEDESTSIDIEVEQGYITSDICKQKDTFFNLGKCLESNLFENSPTISFSISCRELGSAQISLVYRKSNTYILVYNTQSSSISDITLNMGYFGSYENTLFANWFLKEYGSNVDSTIWLKKDLQDNDVESNALLYLITEQTSFTDKLATLQDINTGNFDNSPYKTGLACKSLDIAGNYDSELTSAKDWLLSQQLKSGSWKKNIRETAMVLYGCFANENVNTPLCEGDDCFPNLDINLIECNEDNDCSLGEVCNAGTCEEEPACYTDDDCFFGEVCNAGTCEEKSADCNYNDICEAELGEDEDSCPADCFEATAGCEIDEDCSFGETCNLGECISKTNENQEPQKEQGGFFWIIALLFILILAGGAAYYFFIMKQGKSLKNIFTLKKKKKPTNVAPFKQEIKTYPQPKRNLLYRKPPTKQSSSTIESELKKSMEEAKKLLKSPKK